MLGGVPAVVPLMSCCVMLTAWRTAAVLLADAHRRTTCHCVLAAGLAAARADGSHGGCDEVQGLVCLLRLVRVRQGVPVLLGWLPGLGRGRVLLAQVAAVVCAGLGKMLPVRRRLPGVRWLLRRRRGLLRAWAACLPGLWAAAELADLCEERV